MVGRGVASVAPALSSVLGGASPPFFFFSCPTPLAPLARPCASARHPNADPWVGLVWAIDVTTKFAFLRVPRVAVEAKEAAGSI